MGSGYQYKAHSTPGPEEADDAVEEEGEEEHQDERLLPADRHLFGKLVYFANF